MPQLDEITINAVWTTDAHSIGTTFLTQDPDLLQSLHGVHLLQWMRMLHNEDGSHVALLMDAALNERTAFRYEHRVLCTDQVTRWVVTTGIPRFGQHREFEGFSGAIVDVTAQREALAHALRSESEHRLIVDNTMDLIAHCGTDGNYIHVSSAYEKLLGWTPGEMVGHPVIDFLHPDDRAHAYAALAHLFGGSDLLDVVEVRKRDRNGRYISLGTKGSKVTDPSSGRIVGAVLVSRDITREKEMLHRLERMAEQNTAFIENSPDIMMRLDFKATVLHVNKAVQPILGYQPTELIGQAGMNYICPEFHTLTANNLRVLERGDGQLSSTVACLCKDGRIVHLAWSLSRPAGSNVIYATARDVTEGHLTRLALQQAHEHVRTILESIDDGFFSINTNWEITYANTLAAAFVGVDRDESIGKVLWNVAEGLSESSIAQAYRDAMATRTNGFFETYYEPAQAWLSVRVYAHEEGLSVFFHDITARVERENAVRESEHRFREMVAITPAGYLLTNAAGTVQEVNPALCQLSGYAREELIGRDIVSILADGHSSVALNVRRCGSPVHALETVIRHKDGGQVFALVNQTVQRGDDGAPLSLTAFITDITERKCAEARLEELATRDTLTGLPNRAWINQRVKCMLEEAVNGMVTAVLFIDLNRFKEVNDSMGHATGDHLLQQVSRRLQASTRPGDVVARLGGDEFVVAANCSDRSAASGIAKRLGDSLTAPFVVDGMEIYVGASIGISLSDIDGSTPELLFQNADMAMYKAKALGNGGHQFFEPEMGVLARLRLQLEVALPRALDQGQFELHYQPRVDLRTLRVRGVEALLRWNHPQLGQIAPLQFIPIAEERGHIEMIGKWVLQEACHQAKRLMEKSGTSLNISVNVSARQLRSPALVAYVEQALQESGLPPSALELELTESALIEDIDQSAEILWRLKNLGVRLSLDDFGTGYSSLSYLKRFPVDVLKLDRSFVCQQPLGESNVAFVKALVDMAHALELSVVAEGVETQSILEMLRLASCDEGQGYVLAKPMTMQQLEDFLHIPASVN